jgi:ATP-dependent RNA helicase DeaD
MTDDLNTTATFDALPLHTDVRRAIDEAGWTTPTPVQLAAYEPASEGKDLVVQARTGTGKTAAFAIPLVDKRVRGDGGAQVLILAPTRELALQSGREIERIGVHRGIRAVAIYGGAPMDKQVRELEGGAQIVSGTPGRVLDHLRRGTLNGEQLRVLVLDEADEMLSMGFAEELNAIVEMLPKSRQTMLFSATLDDSVQRLANRFLKDPVQLALSSDQVGAQGISHFVYLVSGLGKARDLVRIVEAENPESAIIFCNTKVVTEQVASELSAAGFAADWLNGDLPQSQREAVLQRTREGKLRFMVATDVAARGIDISHLTHVINFDFPQELEQYVHRTGRTGRAGRTGTAISLIAGADLGSLYYLRLSYKIFPIERTLPSEGDLRTRAELDRVEMLDAAFTSPPGAIDRAIARRLLTHDDRERLIAGLVHAFFGTQGEAAQVDEQASAARRSKAPRPVVAEAERPAESEREPRRRRRREETPSSEAQTVVETRREPPPEAPREREEAPRRRREAPVPTDGEPTSERERFTEDGMTNVFVNLGRRENVKVVDLLRLFEERAGLGKAQLGRIRIRDRHTFVGVPKDRADDAIAKIQGAPFGDKTIVAEVARADQAPSTESAPPDGTPQ